MRRAKMRIVRSADQGIRAAISNRPQNLNGQFLQDFISNLNKDNDIYRQAYTAPIESLVLYIGFSGFLKLGGVEGFHGSGAKGRAESASYSPFKMN